MVRNRRRTLKTHFCFRCLLFDAVCTFSQRERRKNIAQDFKVCWMEGTEKEGNNNKDMKKKNQTIQSHTHTGWG